MKTERCGTFKRWAAILLTVVLLAGVFTLGAFANSSEDDKVSQELYNLWWKSWNEKEAGYKELCEKYPERADVHYALSTTLYGEKEMQELDKVLELVEKYPKANWYVMAISQKEQNLMMQVYAKKADLYLDTYHDQEEYITWKRKELEERDKDARLWFNGGTDTAPAVMDIQTVEANRALLNEIESWYQAGGTDSFSAWEDHVQLNISEDKKTVQVTLVGDDKTTELTMTLTTPLEKVMLGVDQMCLVIPKDNTIRLKKVCYKEDGSVEETTEEKTYIYESEDFDITEICQKQDIEVPSKVKKFMQNNTSHETSSVWYRILTSEV